jgi:hypothetical protein
MGTRSNVYTIKVKCKVTPVLNYVIRHCAVKTYVVERGSSAIPDISFTPWPLYPPPPREDICGGEI